MERAHAGALHRAVGRRPTEAAGETLDADARRIEGLQLTLRTPDGVPLEALDGESSGLVERTATAGCSLAGAA